eukprot:1567590-Pyramimonas_sp.AAC.1
MARCSFNPPCVPTVLGPPAGVEMATVSQIAAPQGWRGAISIRCVCPVCWAPQQASKVATVSQIGASPGMA